MENKNLLSDYQEFVEKRPEINENKLYATKQIGMQKEEFLSGSFGVFKSAAFFSYTWSMLIFLWELPSLLLRLDAFDVVSYLAYQLVFKLFSIVIVTVFIVGLSFALPRKYIRENLLVTGSLLVFSFAISALIFKGIGAIIQLLTTSLSTDRIIASQISFAGYLSITLVLSICAILLGNKPAISKVVKNVVDSFLVLVCIYLALSVISIILIVYRNIP